ncbi:hypothetical protein DO65_6200 [Burkholderia pseudomallei]|nr:hypothetical protein DO65_6200 [Burkholderia pseudomallei]
MTEVTRCVPIFHAAARGCLLAWRRAHRGRQAGGPDCSRPLPDCARCSMRCSARRSTHSLARARPRTRA